MDRIKMINKNQLVRRWLRVNEGLIKFDFKAQEVVFVDGGLFSFKSSVIKLPKVTGLKQDPVTGKFNKVYSKAKYPSKSNTGVLWFGEIDNTIAFFQGLKKLLNSIGHETSSDSGKFWNVKNT